MSLDAIIDGLISYIGLLILLTFHEFAHAWTAWKCGDDTARRLGRVSLNPVVHMDLLGTVVLPLLVVGLSAADSKLASFIIGWGKPVPVNPYNLRRRRFHDTLVSLAGPGMNVLLAAVLMALGRGFELAGIESMVEVAVRMAYLSLILCFFNLLPVPPLDGSHLLKNAVGMSDETYLGFARYGFVIVILLLQVPVVRSALSFATQVTLLALYRAVGMTT